MSLLRKLIAGLRATFQKQSAEQDLSDELSSFLDSAAVEKMKSGISRDAALRAARLEMGSLDGVKESVRAAGWENLLETLWQDIRFAARMLRKSPGFTTVAVLTLALGIGANTAIFSAIEALLLRPLPFDAAERVITISPNFSPNPYFADIENGATTLGSAAKYEFGNLNFSFRGSTLRIPAAEVSEKFFRVFALAPIRGRAFLRQEEETTHAPVVILSFDLWQGPCHAEPDILGKKIYLNGNEFTVVGVLPEKFDFPDGAQAWLPFPPRFEDEVFGGNAFTSFVVARLRLRVTLEQARSELAAIEQREPLPSGVTISPVTAETLHRSLVGGTRPALLILFWVVVFVLLIACANVTNLLMARSAGRSREVAIRSSLGASRSRLIRQFFVESVLLSFLGGVVGLILGWWTIQSANALVPPRTAFATELMMNGWVIAFTFGVALLTGIVAGLIPSLQSAGADVSVSLKEGAQNARDGLGFRSHHRIRSLLGISEIALTLILVVGAALLLRSFHRLLDVAPGFQPDNVLTARISILGPKFENSAERAAFFQSAIERIRALPGVKSAAFANIVPLARKTIIALLGLNAKNRPTSSSSNLSAIYTSVSPEYFRAMGIPLLKGRVFNDNDTTQTRPVAVISKSLAEEAWPGEDALGQRFAFANEKQQYEVVGIAGDVRQFGQDEVIMPQMYFPLSAEPPDDAFLVVRTDRNLPSLAGTIRQAIRATNSDIPVASFNTMDQLLSDSIAGRRFQTLLTSIFAVLAIVLALVGIYGVFSYAMAQRTHEIGVRIALGAQPPEIVRMVLGEGLILTFTGIAIGVGGALALTRFLRSLLFEIKPTDPATFIGVALLLALIALAACYIPARRAMKVDPMVALRYE